jgi:hypothetical protein
LFGAVESSTKQSTFLKYGVDLSDISLLRIISFVEESLIYDLLI